MNAFECSLKCPTVALWAISVLLLLLFHNFRNFETWQQQQQLCMKSMLKFVAIGILKFPKREWQPTRGRRREPTPQQRVVFGPLKWITARREKSLYEKETIRFMRYTITTTKTNKVRPAKQQNYHYSGPAHTVLL